MSREILLTYSADRFSGALCTLFGLAMYFAIIPAYVEKAEGGNIAPQTLPNILSLVIVFCGVLLAVKPTTHKVQDVRIFMKAGLYVAVLAAAIYAVSLFEFLYVAPVFALVLMIMIGERKPLWLALGTIGTPSLIWFLITQILDRALP
jgi:putative tricarboxylic transport membrane protein